MLSRDEIIEAASKAGFETKRDMIWVDGWEITSTLTRFAALVAAAEREACAKLCEDSINLEPYPTLTKMAAAIRAQAADRLARHGIQLPDEDEEYGNPSF
jgi:hypothetical protein